MPLTKVKNSVTEYLTTATGAVARGIETKLSDIVSAKDFGAVGDGVTDDSAAIQAAIDANKGKTILIPDGTYMHSGITLDGSSYDNTTIVCHGRMKLKPDGGSSTFGGAWVGLLLKNCSNVTVYYKGDGNRSAMTAREQIFCVGIAGGSNHKFPIFDVQELRGDGLYISQLDWLANSATPTNISIGLFQAYNSASDGRNACSVISVDGLYISNFVSIDVGGTIGVTVQPGGLDIEPDFGYQTCKNITIDGGYIRSKGTSGFAILGKAITNDAARDWNCENISVKLTNVRAGTTGSELAAAGITRCKDVKFDLKESYSSARGKARIIDYADDIKGQIKINFVTNGLELGVIDEVKDFDITCFVSNYQGSGIYTTKITEGRIRGRVFGSFGTSFAVECNASGRGAITQSGITYQVDAPYDGTVTRAFRNEPSSPVTFSDCVASDCDWRGYASFAVTSDANIRYVDVKGMNRASAIPSSGNWGAGTFVVNTVPTNDANNMILEGWQRLTNGNAHVLGTDWVNRYVSTVSPAN